MIMRAKKSGQGLCKTQRVSCPKCSWVGKLGDLVGDPREGTVMVKSYEGSTAVKRVKHDLSLVGTCPNCKAKVVSLASRECYRPCFKRENIKEEGKVNKTAVNSGKEDLIALRRKEVSETPGILPVLRDAYLAGLRERQ